MLNFIFSNETDVAIPGKFFSKIVAEFSKNLKSRIKSVLTCKNGEISLNLIKDLEIKLLNSKYRNKNSVTDVLSFAYIENGKCQIGECGIILIGDIFISIDTAKKQALEHKHGLKKELAVLFTHGLLHLFGFNHRNDKEEAEMEKYSRKVLKHLV